MDFTVVSTLNSELVICSERPGPGVSPPDTLASLTCEDKEDKYPLSISSPSAQYLQTEGLLGMGSSKTCHYSEFLAKTFRRSQSLSPADIASSSESSIRSESPNAPPSQTPKRSRFAKFLESVDFTAESSNTGRSQTSSHQSPGEQLSPHTPYPSSSNQPMETQDVMSPNTETLHLLDAVLNEHETAQTFTADSTAYRSIMEELVGKEFDSLGAPSKVVESAVFGARSLEEELRQIQTILVELSSNSEESVIQSTLSCLEHNLQDISKEASTITRPEASRTVTVVNELITQTKQLLQDWWTRYPDLSPFQVDNSASAIIIMFMEHFSYRI
ncbi:hypothetical protein GYMLUDRAFT_63876 [Collybiopsis luxurians FD-317 M1]|uniref:Uncharacterized protein n=1 Tax=Collybiopsis luxurians FD-317 M1 TaxID=944289 RepID=A0A0D0ARW1_9AGAR|nr:hypothetical protein GYMLUDRAFT_63876 [Collybiopsis luxurians FD-317 M1]